MEPSGMVVDIAGIRVGFAICYDLRFPGLFQTMADNGAQLHVISASWGAGPGKVDHREVLARARALDTTTFAAACDQASPVDYRGSAPRGVGHSLVAAPDGGVLGSLGAEPDLLTVDLELDTVGAVRRSLPVLANRRI
jgi:deaminated glutathione amidase